MLQAIVTIVATPDKRSEILKSMRSTVGPTRVQQGCIECRVQIDAVDPEVLTLIQTWKTRADLERHVKSDVYRTVLAIMESSMNRPEVAFHTISKTEGLEAVKKLRQAGA
jgi:quinol monooxygenase YgiN